PRPRAPAGAVMAQLELAGITVRFGGVVAVAKLDLRVDAGQLVAMIGPNGAGKTTAFNVITGGCPPTEGAVFFDGKRIDGKPAHQVNRRGVARTFQNIRLFRSLTVLENARAALAGAPPPRGGGARRFASVRRAAPPGDRARARHAAAPPAARRARRRHESLGEGGAAPGDRDASPQSRTQHT